MSYPDYNQKTDDHQSMLIVVRQIGQRTKARHFNRTYDKVTRCQCVQIQEPTQRFVWVRYKKEYPPENNAWGDFQAHRKVLGLICVGRCDSEQELQALQRSYDYQCEQYATTLLDSRLLVIGVDKTGRVVRRRRCSSSGSESLDNTPTNSLTRPKVPKGSPVKTDNVMAPIEIKCDNQSDFLTVPTTDEIPTGLLSDSTTSTEPKFMDPLRNDDVMTSTQSSDLTLEVDKNDNPTLSERYQVPKAPNFWFYSSTDDLLDINERMDEFVTSLFWVIEGKRRDRSFEKLDPMPLLTAPFERKDLVGVDLEGRTHKKRCLGRLRKHLADLCLLAGLPGEAIYHYQTALETLKSANDWLWMGGCYEGLCAASVAIHYPRAQKSFQRQYQSMSAKRGVKNNQATKFSSSSSSNGLDLAVDTLSRQCLAHDDIIDRYKEALQQYSKYRAASVIAMEASIKAGRVLVLQKKNLVAADFLQNVVYLNIQLSEEEKIQRYSTLALLYSQIGFHRKAAFFKRVAAMQCVAPSNPRPGWSQCYNLLVQTLGGYRIPLDPRKFPHDHTSGWPVIQSRVLHELVFSARKMGNPAVAIRHMTFLLHCLLDHLSEQERRDISQVLENYTSKCPDAQVTSIFLDSGITLPPVQLSKLPIVRSFKPLDLAPHLRPVDLRPAQVEKPQHSSPFIYSPLTQSRTVSKMRKSNSDVMEFSWVEGHICEVLLQVSNPMPYELKVSNMSLLTEGVLFESYPASLSLPAESGPHPVKLIGTPKSAGKLKILGYTTTVLGLKSQCLLESLPATAMAGFTMKIVPSLPKLEVSTSLPQSSSFSNVCDSANVIASASLMMYAGQSKECEIRLRNAGEETITNIQLTMDSRLAPELLNSVFVWSADNLESQLPLKPGQQASFTVYVHGLADFLPLDRIIFDESGTYLSPTGRPRRTGGASSPDQPDDSLLRTFESLLRVEYSSEASVQAGYCRQCSVQFCAEVHHSLVFTKWDVLPADSPAHCHLVLDVTNQSSSAVDVTYNQTQTINIPAKNTKRVAIKVGRCSSLPAPVASQTETSYSRYQQELLALKYSQYMAQYIDVRWHMANGDHGRMSMEKLTWDLEQLNTLRTSALQWELLVQDDVYDPESLRQCTVGEEVSLRATITNHKDSPLEDVSVSVTCDCDHVTSSEQNVTSSEQYVSYLGATSTPKKTISQSESLTLESSLLFLFPGHYTLQVTCSSQPITDRLSFTCYPVHLQVGL